MKSLRVLVLAVVSAASITAGCTESFDGGGACPSLCPAVQTSFRDTTLDAVTLDSTLGNFPTLGLSTAILLANRPDTVVTKAVLRFDVLVSDYLPNRGSVTDTIRAIDSVFLRLPLDSTGRRGTNPVTISVYDVDSTASDSVTAIVKTFFRADRLLGSLTFTPSQTADSLRVPLNRTKLLAKVVARTRLRVGVQITSGTGQVRIRTPISGTTASLSYDASADTVYNPISIKTTTSVSGLTTDAELAYQAYSIIETGSVVPDAITLLVGGIPSYRSYLRFAVPAGVTDSGTIVRAELLLTQRPSQFGNSRDSIAIVPMVPSTTSLLTDVRRILELSADGVFAALDSTRLVPADSGVRAVNVLSLVRKWSTLSADQPRALAFRINNEGSQASQLRFFSSEAAAGLRPRLRITYLPRTQVALP